MMLKRVTGSVVTGSPLLQGLTAAPSVKMGEVHDRRNARGLSLQSFVDGLATDPRAPGPPSPADSTSRAPTRPAANCPMTRTLTRRQRRSNHRLVHRVEPVDRPTQPRLRLTITPSIPRADSADASRSATPTPSPHQHWDLHHT